MGANGYRTSHYQQTTAYMDAFDEYYKQIVRNTMFMYVAKKYYNKYCGVRENIEVTKYI